MYDSPGVASTLAALVIGAARLVVGKTADVGKTPPKAPGVGKAMDGSHLRLRAVVLTPPPRRAGKAVAMAAVALLVFAMLAVAAPNVVLAADGAASANAASGGSEAIFIAQLGVLLLVGRLMGEAAQRIGQPALMGQLIGGLLLGPSVLGLIWPAAQHALFPSAAEQKSMINAISQLGILLLLLLTGMETDLQLVKRAGRAAVTVAVAGIAIPFICGFALGEWLPAELLPNPDARMVTAIFLGTALSISSVKIVAMVVREMNFMRRDLGQIIVASAILEDTIGWVIIAVALGLASAGRIDVWSVSRAILGTALFLAVSLTVGRRIVFQLIRWANDNFVSEFPVITTILVIMVAMALTTQLIGVNTVLGAFVAGVLIGESPILTRHIEEQLRGVITALFMPVFFGLSGLSADLTVLRRPDLAALAVGLIFIASVGKFTGAFLGGTVGGLTRAESLALGCGMNARGSTEVIVATIGLTAGVLNQNLYTLIVTMAVITTLSMPTQLRWALKRLPMRKKERIRLAREELDARGFVTNLERLLLASDDSANGKIATQLAGIIAGSGGKPTTILDLSKEDRNKKAANAKDEKKPETTSLATTDDDRSERDLKNAAEASTTLEAHPDDEKAGTVDVTTRHKEAVDSDAVAGEARKGYDLMVVGIAKTRNPKGGFSKDISAITSSFEGPLAVVDSQNSGRVLPSDRYDRILIPVNGSDVSRRAAEVGLTLARASDAEVTALYVIRSASSAGNGKSTARKNDPRKDASSRTASRKRAKRRSEQAVLQDIAALADRYEVKIRSTTRVNLAPDQAILREAKRGYDLIVLGVSRRPGDTLFFGNTAASVLDHSETSNLFVAS
jgi:Kef-type K+ transport system membrane component KefB/nucleotide-binding universal stress UspA family protein